MTAQQTGPSQARTQMLRAKKILVAKGGVFAHGHALCGKLRVRKDARAKSLHLDRSAKSTLEMGVEVGVHPVSPHKEGNRHLQGNDRRGDSGAGLPPFVQLAHPVRKSKRVPLKKVALGGRRELASCLV